MALRVRKGNRVITVDESRLNGYLIRGYDQIDEKGKIVKRATGGRNISIGEYNKLVKEKEILKERIKELEEDNELNEKEIERLEKENKKLKGTQHNIKSNNK